MESIKHKKTMRVHVTYGSNKKILRTSSETFYSDVKSMFCIKDKKEHLLVQEYRETWKEWVDVSSSNIIDGSKLLIKIIVKKPDNQQRSHNQPAFHTGSFDSSAKYEKSPEPSKKMKILCLKNFHVPQIFEHMQMPPKNNAERWKEMKQTIVSVLFDAIKKVTFSPMLEDINYVVDMFLKKNPHFISSIDHSSTRVILIEKLQERFARFGKEMALKEIEASKRKKSQITPQEVKRVRRVETNDQRTQTMQEKSRSMPQERKKERHVEKRNQGTQTVTKTQFEDMTAVIDQIKKKWLEPTQDMNYIKCLMRITFQTRRNFIVREVPPIQIIKERFPALFHCDLIKDEFWRITGKNSMEIFRSNLEKFSSAIYNMMRADAGIKRKIRLAKCNHKNVDNKIISLLLLPSLLRENLSFLCLDDARFDKKQELPWINANANLTEVINGKGIFKIYAETHLLCEPQNFIEAMECFIGCFFVFNMEYNKNNSRTLQIFQTLFLEIEEDEEMANPLHQDVIELVEELKENI